MFVWLLVILFRLSVSGLVTAESLPTYESFWLSWRPNLRTRAMTILNRATMIIEQTTVSAIIFPF